MIRTLKLSCLPTTRPLALPQDHQRRYAEFKQHKVEEGLPLLDQLHAVHEELSRLIGPAGAMAPASASPRAAAGGSGGDDHYAGLLEYIETQWDLLLRLTEIHERRLAELARRADERTARLQGLWCTCTQAECWMKAMKMCLHVGWYDTWTSFVWIHI